MKLNSKYARSLTVKIVIACFLWFLYFPLVNSVVEPRLLGYKNEASQDALNGNVDDYAHYVTVEKWSNNIHNVGMFGIFVTAFIFIFNTDYNRLFNLSREDELEESGESESCN